METFFPFFLKMKKWEENHTKIIGIIKWSVVLMRGEKSDFLWLVK